MRCSYHEKRKKAQNFSHACLRSSSKWCAVYLERSIFKTHVLYITVGMTAADDDCKRLIVIGPRNILFKAHTLIFSVFSLRTPFTVIASAMFNVNVLLCFRLLLKKQSLNILSQQHHHHHPSAFFILCPVNGI